MSKKTIIPVGVLDDEIDLFEGMYSVPEGMYYNSYVIVDEKIAVMDSVEEEFDSEWIRHIYEALGGKSPDYLVVQHMEPDHSGSVEAFVHKYPNATVVGNKKTFTMLEEYFGEDFPKNRLVVADGDELSLGFHTLKFIFAPMVHWPEVMFTYCKEEQTLFSADAFGKFGKLDGEWACEARRYYFGIVGKYGVQVKSVLSKLEGYEISVIAPLHGPVLRGNELAEALRLYKIWSAYDAETKGVFIAYASVYGHTEQAAYILKDMLEENGIKVEIADLSRDDWAECVEGAFRYSHLVVAAPTYNGGVFPAAREFIDRLAERNYQKRKVAFIENGSWAPVSAKFMKEKLSSCKEIEFASTQITLRPCVDENATKQLSALAEEFAEK